MRKFTIFFSILLGFIFLTGCSQFVKLLSDVSDVTRNQAIQLLKSSINGQPVWVSVHAAEYLLDLGYNEGIYERFQKENDSLGNTPVYRIGIWRVLARATKGEEKKIWIDSIVNVYKDHSAIDRVHAVEAL